MKKITLISLLFILLTACNDDSSSTPPPPPPIQISTAKQLSEIRNNLSENYILVNDITLPATGTAGCAPELEANIPDYCTAGWEPIGQLDSNDGVGGTSTPFTGKFDGGGFVIKNLYINRSSNVHYAVGLFGYSKGSISNLGVENIDIKFSDVDNNLLIHIGGLVGNNGGDIISSHTTGSISATIISKAYTERCIGGLVGYRYGGKIASSYSTSDVLVSGSGLVGGLVGSSGVGVIDSSYATGRVSSDGGSYVGGLVGKNNGSITSSYATGNTSSSKFVAGGLVGNNEYATITSSYAIGKVSGDEYAGGLVGYNVFGNITSSYATGSVFASYAYARVGGLIGLSQYGVMTSTYATGEVSATSGIAGALAGGLVGDHYAGDIISSYATGNVSAGSGTAGGLVGKNDNDIISSYKNSAANITGTIIDSSGTPIAERTPMLEGNFSDHNIWKSNIAFPELAWQK